MWNFNGAFDIIWNSVFVMLLFYYYFIKRLWKHATCNDTYHEAQFYTVLLYILVLDVANKNAYISYSLGFRENNYCIAINNEFTKKNQNNIS